MLKEIADKIIEILKADEKLNGKIQMWIRGVPTRFEKYPYLAVVWAGGEVRFQAGIYNYMNNYDIIVVDLKPSPEDAENSVMDLSENVFATLKNNPSLDGAVSDSYITRWDSEGIPTERGSLKGARITLQTIMVAI
jgi:hypothetical protein